LGTLDALVLSLYVFPPLLVGMPQSDAADGSQHCAGKGQDASVLPKRTSVIATGVVAAAVLGREERREEHESTNKTGGASDCRGHPKCASG
jgi:hypothetical protein